MMTTQSWRDMPAGRKLDNLIAHKMGWKLRAVDSGHVGPNGEPESMIYMVYDEIKNPDGEFLKFVEGVKAQDVNLEEIWNAVLDGHYSYSHGIPLWSTDRWDAYDLFEPSDPVELQVIHSGVNVIVRCVDVSHGCVFTASEWRQKWTFDKEALLICRAWLAWNEIFSANHSR